MTKSQLASIIYHELFSFSLSENELDKWQIHPQVIKKVPEYSPQNNFALRHKREKISQKKLHIAKNASKVLGRIPTVQFVGITGSLAMMNAKSESDIDLMIITSSRTLWTTRLISYVVLRLSRYSLRKPESKDERDKLCLNMWIDVTNLKITKKNLYTAHEIVQIIPLINKNNVYEQFICQNAWVFNYWPNVIKKPRKTASVSHTSIIKIVEPIARSIQLYYMRNKKSREFVSTSRAFFHPLDWGQKVMNELSMRGLILKN